jgi:hypothetical protein
MKMNKSEMMEQAKKRVNKLEFGDPVTNVCAGHPERKHAYFCQLVTKSRTNRAGVTHRQYYAKCTNRKGAFFDVGIEVIFAGHLPDDECKELFAPIWGAMYGGANA